MAIYGIVTSETKLSLSEPLSLMSGWFEENCRCAAPAKTLQRVGVAVSYPEAADCCLVDEGRGGFTLIYGRVKLAQKKQLQDPMEVAREIHRLCMCPEPDLAEVTGEYVIISVAAGGACTRIYRDNLGFKSIYYAKVGSTVLFATKPQPIIASGLVQKGLDLFSVYSYLYMKGVPRHHTMYSEVSCLPPGHCLELERDVLSCKSYKDIALPAPGSFTSDDDHAAAVTKIMTEGVAGIPDFDNNAALLLSGGLDSTYLFTMLRQMEVKFDTYTVIFEPEPDFSRPALAVTKKVAEHYGGKVDYVHLQPNFVLNHASAMMKTADVPFAGGFQTYSGLLAASALKPVRYLVTGEGADTALGMNRYLGYFNSVAFALRPVEAILGGRLYRVAKGIERRFRNEDRGRFIELLYQLASYHSGFVNWKSTGLQLESVESLFHNWEAASYEDRLRKVHVELLDKFPVNDYLLRDNYKNLRTYTAEQAIRPFRNLCDLHDSHMYFPFLQEAFLGYCLQIPQKYKKKKVLLSDAVGKLTNPLRLQFVKEAFEMPMGRWLKEELRPLVSDLYSKAAIQKRNIFNPVTVTALLDDFYSGKPGVSASDVWALVTLEIWLQTHYDGI